MGAAVAAGRPLRLHFAAGGRRRERHARGQPLGHHHDVGHDAEVLKRKPFARAPKARLHLVGHQQNAIVVADFAQPLHEAHRRHHVAALAQHGLNHHRRRLIRCGLALQQLL